MAGWEDLGSVLAGGIDREGQFQNGRYRSAQTEAALSSARENQAKAMRAEAENKADQDFRAMQAAGGVDYGNPTADMITTALLAGRGGDLPHAGEFNLQAQQFRNRAAISDVNTPAETRLRAAQSSDPALVGKGDVVPFGQTGKLDLTQDDQNPVALGDAFAKALGPGPLPTAPIQNYNFRSGLKTPEDQSMFDEQVRKQQIINSNGVISAVPGINPSGAAPPKTLVDRDTAAGNAAAVTGAKTTATTQSKLANALPGVVEDVQNMKGSIDKLRSMPGFSQIYGVQGQIDPRQLVAGTDYSNADALRKQLGSQAFQASIAKMRGLGALSDREGLKVESAMTAALDPKLGSEEADLAFDTLQFQLDRLLKVAEKEAGMAAGPTPTSSPRAFATVEEAEAAGLAPGTQIIVNGRKARVQ